MVPLMLAAAVVLFKTFVLRRRVTRRNKSVNARQLLANVVVHASTFLLCVSKRRDALEGTTSVGRAVCQNRQQSSRRQ